MIVVRRRMPATRIAAAKANVCQPSAATARVHEPTPEPSQSGAEKRMKRAKSSKAVAPEAHMNSASPEPWFEPSDSLANEADIA
jgi:hypothetical protein